MDLTLYAVGASGRVNLGDLAKDVKFYNVHENVDGHGVKDGTLVLSPVRVVPATGKRVDPVVEDGEPETGQTPWEQ